MEAVKQKNSSQYIKIVRRLLWAGHVKEKSKE
jgi:hypothetical protein